MGIGGFQSHNAPEPGAKCYLHKVPLNSQGYTRHGQYFGVGSPLYRCESTCGEFLVYQRAETRKGALSAIRAQYPSHDITLIRGC